MTATHTRYKDGPVSTNDHDLVRDGLSGDHDLTGRVGHDSFGDAYAFYRCRHCGTESVDIGWFADVSCEPIEDDAPAMEVIRGP